tara:strand:- start:5221 stop:5472 length:252 start_codon:yes stop_codon:yes gene_type:complete
MSKARKPRATQRRVEAAEFYLNIAGTCTVFAGMPSDNLNNNENADLINIIKENRKMLSMGKEYIQDLLLWEKDRLLFKKKSDD